MKTLVRNDTNESLYLFPDAKTVTVGDTNVLVGDPVEMAIGDCNSSNSTLFTDVTPPDGWTGCKYFYTEADGWTLNSAYVNGSN